MPDIRDFFKDESQMRREALLTRLKQLGGTFTVEDLAEALEPFRLRAAGESLREYREIEYLYYRNYLEGRWSKYLGDLERDLLKQFGYGGMYHVANQLSQGRFQIPQELIQYDMYDVQSNSAMNLLLEIGIPTDVQAQSIASYLESSAWRTAAESASQLSENVLWKVNDDVKKLVNQGMLRARTEAGFGRADFVDLLKGPLEGTSPITGEARARMIARTEATRARAQATKDMAEAMRAQGYQIVEIWRIAENTNVCPDCEALDGTVRGASWTAYPPLHPNCDCDVDIELLSDYQSGRN